jgi:hypothetical protein
MNNDVKLTPDEARLDAEMRALVGTDDIDVPVPTHDAWRDLGGHVRARVAKLDDAEPVSPFRLLVAAACFAVALLAIAIARPPQQDVVDTPMPEPVEVAESATALVDGSRELAEIDALMQQIELDELAIGLRDSGVVGDVEEAIDLLREYGVDEDKVFEQYVNSL